MDRLRDGRNYDVWVIRMKGFLKEIQLWEIVDGTVVKSELILRVSGVTRDSSVSL